MEPSVTAAVPGRVLALRWMPQFGPWEHELSLVGLALLVLVEILSAVLLVGVFVVGVWKQPLQASSCQRPYQLAAGGGEKLSSMMPDFQKIHFDGTVMLSTSSNSSLVVDLGVASVDAVQPKAVLSHQH